MESNAEIRKWQEAARAAKVKADLEKLSSKKAPKHLVLEKKESFQIHENEGGPPPAIPRGMPVEEKAIPEGEQKRTMTPAEKQKAYRERRKLANKL